LAVEAFIFNVSAPQGGAASQGAVQMDQLAAKAQPSHGL